MNDGWDDDDDDVNVDDLLEDWGGGEQDPTTAPASTTRMMDEDDPGNSSNIIDAPRTDGRTTDATQQDQSEEEEVEEDDGGDGWDDDDDLDLNFSEHNDNNNLSLNNVKAPAAAAASAAGPYAKSSAATTTTKTTAVKQSPSPPAAAAAVVEDGWGDDEDDDLEFSAHSNNDNMMVPMNQQTNRVAAVLLTVEEPQISKASTYADAPADDAPGWKDDDDLEGFDFSETSVGGATAEDEAVDVAAAVVGNNNNIAPFAAPSSTPAEQQWIQELTHYLETLPAHAQSITAVLEAEYNTPAKAFELQQYYQERPQLLQYTVEKELARMEYTLITSTGDIVTDPTEIAQHFYQEGAATASQPSPLLTPRCANQSLLADIVQVLTGPDRLVRPQYLCAAVASQCKLRVDWTQHVVEIVAALDLSLPTTTASRWKIAELAVVIVFVCPPVQQPQNSHHRIHEPFVEYRLAELRPTVKPTTDPDFQQQLRSTVAFLMDMESAFESEEDRMDWQQPQQPNINFRDAYLQQSRQLQQDAVDGLKSAWQDLNTATGLGDKFRRLPSFLPERDVLEAAALAQEQHQTVLLQQQQQQQPQQRPTSILGGFVRSLAKSVALPDEDPNLYQDWNANNNINSNNQRRQPSPVATKLYNTSMTAPPPVTTTTIPHFYRKDNDQGNVAQHSSLPKSNTIPRLYHRQNSPPLDTNHREEPPPSDIPRLYHRETPQPNTPPNSNIISFEPTSRSKDDEPGSVRPNASIQQEDAEELPQQVEDDGWGDDDLDVDDDEDDATDPFTTAAVVEEDGEDDRLRALQDWTYDPETDVIPTRRRWINPIPGRVRMLQ